VAQLAINAREGCTAASKMAEEARDELQATEIVKDKVQADLQVGLPRKLDLRNGTKYQAIKHFATLTCLVEDPSGKASPLVVELNIPRSRRVNSSAAEMPGI